MLQLMRQGTEIKSMPQTYSWGFSLFLTLLTACSSQSSAGELKKDLTTVKSWTATAHMVGDSWIKGAVPEAYAKQTLQAAQSELHKQGNTLAKVAPAQIQTQLSDQLQQLEQTIGQMTLAVEHKDRPAMIQQIRQLSTQEHAIKVLAATVGEQS
jgi:hypothetical protein